MTDENIFDPDELESIAQRLEEVLANEDEGYEMIFYISQNDAEDLLENYRRAQKGDPKSKARCLLEYSKIMEYLDVAVQNNNEEDS
jgi:hypothetical protein